METKSPFLRNAADSNSHWLFDNSTLDKLVFQEKRIH